MRIRRALQTVYVTLIRASTPSERLRTLGSYFVRANHGEKAILTPKPRRRPPGRTLHALAPLLALLALLAVAAPASAAPSCARQVINDWYDNGRVDRTYALHCYDDAIEALPRDVRDYSSAKEDIQRALQARLRGEDPPPARTDPSPQSPSSPGDPDSPVSSEDPGDEGDGETTGTPPSAGPDDPDGGEEAAAPLDSESASSIPIPLLILAGLALLLVLGGSAGYLIRRLQARRAPPTTI